MTAGATAMTYRPKTIQESRVLVQADLDEQYEAFFKKKLSEYGVDDLGDLSDEDKKKFFNEVELEWEEGKGPTDEEQVEAAIQRANPAAQETLAAEAPAETAPAAPQVTQADSFGSDEGEDGEEEDDVSEGSEGSSEDDGDYSTDDMDMDQRMFAVAEIASSLGLPASAQLAIEEAAEAVSQVKAEYGEEEWEDLISALANAQKAAQKVKKAIRDDRVQVKEVGKVVKSLKEAGAVAWKWGK